MTTDTRSKTIYAGDSTNVLQKEEHSNTAFYKDFRSMKLFAIMQTPGCFFDVYTEAKAVKYLEVNLFTTSIDISFISDIARLAAEISQLGRKVNIFFPQAIPSYFTNIRVLEEAYQKTDHVSYTPDVGDQFVIKYLPTKKQGVYNIEIHDGIHNTVICGYVDAESINEIAKRPDIDEIHLPYLLNRYGGVTAKEVLSAPRANFAPESRMKLRINGFQNAYEYMEAVSKYPNKIVEVIDRV